MKRSQGTSYYTTDDILRIVNEIRAYVDAGTTPNETRRRQVLEKMYPEFAMRHAHLFTMVCEENFDMDRLQFMLSLRDQVEKKEVSFEDASKTVGEVMFNAYVKDKIKPPPASA
jgi:hypothetical protein